MKISNIRATSFIIYFSTKIERSIAIPGRIKKYFDTIVRDNNNLAYFCQIVLIFKKPIGKRQVASSPTAKRLIVQSMPHLFAFRIISVPNESRNFIKEEASSSSRWDVQIMAISAIFIPIIRTDVLSLLSLITRRVALCY